MRGFPHLLITASGLLSALPAGADPARIIAVEATQGAAGSRLDVTVSHGDTGWDDYADGWRVEAPDGSVLGGRPLAHPHVDEQPFTRSLRGVAIPQHVREIVVRARTSVEGWGTEAVPVSLR
jgi:hypothetical protein